MKKIIICLFSGLLLFGSSPFAIAKKPLTRKPLDKVEVTITVEWGKKLNEREDIQSKPYIDGPPGPFTLVNPFSYPSKAHFQFTSKTDFVEQQCHTNAPVKCCSDEVIPPSVENCEMVITYPANIPVKVYDKFHWYNINLYKVKVARQKLKQEEPLNKVSVARQKLKQEEPLIWEEPYWVDAKYITCNDELPR